MFILVQPRAYVLHRKPETKQLVYQAGQTCFYISMCNHLQYIATSYETADFIDTANGSEVERKVIKRESICGKFQCTEQKSSNYLEQSTESVQRLAGSLVIQV